MDVISTAEVAAGERFAFLREANSKLWVPYDIPVVPRAESGFRAQVCISDFGAVQTTRSPSDSARLSILTPTPGSGRGRDGKTHRACRLHRHAPSTPGAARASRVRDHRTSTAGVIQVIRTRLATGATVGALILGGLIVGTGAASTDNRHGTSELAGYHENSEASGHFDGSGHFEGNGHVDGG